jgi:hypothetical protein
VCVQEGLYGSCIIIASFRGGARCKCMPISNGPVLCNGQFTFVEGRVMHSVVSCDACYKIAVGRFCATASSRLFVFLISC